MKKLIAIAGLLLIISSCYNDKADKLYPQPVNTSTTCDTTAVSFKNDITPIINTYCAIAGGCHDAIGSTTSGYNFTTYAGIQPVATANILVNDINGTPARGYNAMPKNLPQIPACEIEKFTAWVNQGALDN